MKAYRFEKRIAQEGSLSLEALPFEEGEWVEVIVLARRKVTSKKEAHSPLRGTVRKYEAPTEPVASNQWEAAQ